MCYMGTGAQAGSDDYYAGVDLPSLSSDEEGSFSDSPASAAIATADVSQMPRCNGTGGRNQGRFH